MIPYRKLDAELQKCDLFESKSADPCSQQCGAGCDAGHEEQYSTLWSFRTNVSLTQTIGE